MGDLTYDNTQFFEVRHNSVTSGAPLAYDLYLFVNQKHTLFRRRGDILTPERVKLLALHGGEKFLVPADQRPVYMESLRNLIKNPDSTVETKSRFIKESAYLHVNDLFIKQDVSEVVVDAKSLVEEMVSFVSTDVSAVTTLMRLSTHDYYTYNHCVDVSVYAIVLAKKVFGEDKEMLMLAGLGGLLHDIGKRKIDWNIINKQGGLTGKEWEEIKNHPTYGKEVLENTAVVPIEAKLVVYEHHENFDGTGYPQKLSGEQISKLARVVAIADVFDALTTKRSYHHPVTPKEALDTMYGMQPGKFDPGIFKSFNKNFDKKPDILLGSKFDACAPNARANLRRR